MSNATFDVEENCFKPFTTRERSARFVNPADSRERLGMMSSRLAQSFPSGSNAQSLPGFYSPARKAVGLSYSSPGFTDELRSLYASERFGLSEKLCHRLVELLSLQPGWDGQSALPPKAEALANVVSLLVFLNATLPQFREPFLVPTIGGFAQLEWHNEQRTLELESTPDGWSIVGSEYSSQREQVYYEAESTRAEIEKLIPAYRWFEGAELLWPII